MSGLEVAALLAGIVSAFSGTTSMYRDWRCDKKERLEKQQNQQLETKLQTSGSTIQGEYDVDFARLGQVFARGDDTSRQALMGHLIILQQAIIAVLSDNSNVGAFIHPYHDQLSSTSTTVRIGVQSALQELFQRQSQARPVARTIQKPVRPADPVYWYQRVPRPNAGQFANWDEFKQVEDRWMEAPARDQESTYAKYLADFHRYSVQLDEYNRQ